MEWDAPEPLDQGVGAPKPYPSQAGSERVPIVCVAEAR